MKYYLIAGERSGDLHGGNLVKALKSFDNRADFRGFGGDNMSQQGMVLCRHYRNLAFMGFWEVLLNLTKISRYLKEVKIDIFLFRPVVVILIDYGGFNLKVASFLKREKIKCFYYITPKVWAWNQSRARRIKKLVDRMFVILPFEKDFYSKYDWQVDYVGNPVLDAVQNHQVKDLQIDNNSLPVVAILPGSRLQEIKGVLNTIEKVIENNGHLHFVIAKVDNLPMELYASVKTLKNVEVFEGETYNLLNKASAAIVTSGTATLETALFKVPQIVVYSTSKVSYWIGRMVIKVNYISLVNLIANARVVQELIQSDFNPKDLSHELNRLVFEEDYRKNMIEKYNEIENLLDVGSASNNAAQLMFKYLTNSSS